jgi:hypothetical protein
LEHVIIMNLRNKSETQKMLAGLQP